MLNGERRWKLDKLNGGKIQRWQLDTESKRVQKQMVEKIEKYTNVKKYNIIFDKYEWIAINSEQPQTKLIQYK